MSLGCLYIHASVSTQKVTEIGWDMASQFFVTSCPLPQFLARLLSQSDIDRQSQSQFLSQSPTRSLWWNINAGGKRRHWAEKRELHFQGSDTKNKILRTITKLESRKRTWPDNSVTHNRKKRKRSSFFSMAIDLIEKEIS